MRSLVGSLADGLLADAIFIPPCSPIPPTNIRMQGVLKNCTEIQDALSTTCNPKVMSRCLSASDATSLHHCLKIKQLKLTRIPVISIIQS